ncbi:MAG: hypothetical protein AM325_006435 [Candidatus Thorarchaeota archaeon SMTZ1-45]|nr:MAG: hypothetical protein AM325_08185 [Candidatus Thorarchaeota archaeon SMTZ1-45]
MGIMVGGIKTFTSLDLISLSVGVSPINRFSILFWQELEDLLGPILGPIVRGFFEPVYRTFEDTVFRSQFMFTVIWTAMIICGLVFVIYEAPSFLSWIMGTQPTTPKRQATSRPSKTRAQRVSEDSHRVTKSKVQEERERLKAVVERSGVKVHSSVRRMKEELLLDVSVHNGSNHQIDMVVVDIDLPVDINTAIGSFRMQRLGTIGVDETQVAEFRLQERGGDITKIGGHVEFLSASYEVSKIMLPQPEIVE